MSGAIVGRSTAHFKPGKRAGVAGALRSVNVGSLPFPAVRRPRRSEPVRQGESRGDLTPESVTLSDVSVSFGDTECVVKGVSLDVAAGTVLSLLGPSGCGKTTLLRSIAGLQTITHGQVHIGDRLVANGSKSMVPPEQRSVGMVFQTGALFPHLSVAENVRFGLRGKPASNARVDEVLELVDMAGYGDREPGTLSGGQRQRVAVARALAPNPSVLLLDEPFSALDASLRLQVRREVKALLAHLGITTIVVTHDQEEAFALGDAVAVMRTGEVHQSGSPIDLYEKPATPWVAEFVGEGVRLPGRIDGSQIVTAIGSIPCRNLDGGGTTDQNAEVVLRPEHLRLDVDGDAEISDVEYYGHDVRYEVILASGTAVSVRSLEPVHAVGDRVKVTYTGPPVPVWASQHDD